MPTTNPHPIQIDHVQLDVTTRLTADTVTLTYRVSNQRDTPIYLLNRIMRWTSAGLSTSADNLYTLVQDHTLRLAKAYVEIPPNLDVEAPEVPLLTELKPAQVFEETLHLTHPLEPYHPYDQIVWSDSVTEYTRVEFALGWVSGEEAKINRGVNTEGKSVISVGHLEAKKHQHLLVIPLDLQVKTHFK